MRKGFLITITIFLLFLSALIFNGLYKLRKQDKSIENMATFPEIAIYKNDLLLGAEDIFANKKTLFFILNPDCYYCELQIEELLKNQKKLSQLNIYLLIPEEKSDYKKWEQQYKNQLAANVQMCRLKPQDYRTYFWEMKLPTILYYDTNQQLITVHQSYAKLDWIVQNILHDASK